MNTINQEKEKNIRDNISKELHDKATSIEKEALAKYITGKDNLHPTFYHQIKLAEAFRLAANYLGNDILNDWKIIKYEQRHE